jgi:hypothetical protein
MKRTFIFFLAFLIMMPFTASSQNEGIKPVANPAPSNKHPMYEKTTREMAMMREQGTSGGSPCPTGLPSESATCYLEPGWTGGRVLLNDNSLMEDVQLRYDIYHQQLQFVRDDDTLAFAKPEEVKCFMLGDRHFVYADYQVDNIVGHGYFELASEGEYRMMVRRTVKYHADPEGKPSLGEDVYVKECSYFLSKNGETAKPVKLSRKSVLAAFANKQEEIRQFMDDHDIRLNDCHQLKEVVDYYNSLD